MPINPKGALEFLKRAAKFLKKNATKRWPAIGALLAASIICHLSHAGDRKLKL